jgi:hypothetical protein
MIENYILLNLNGEIKKLQRYQKLLMKLILEVVLKL